MVLANVQSGSFAGDQLPDMLESSQDTCKAHIRKFPMARLYAG